MNFHEVDYTLPANYFLSNNRTTVVQAQTFFFLKHLNVIWLQKGDKRHYDSKRYFKILIL